MCLFVVIAVTLIAVTVMAVVVIILWQFPIC